MIAAADPIDELGPPLTEEILAVTDAGFDALAERILAYQRRQNPVYRRFSSHSTYLPVAAFKHAPVTTFDTSAAEKVFRSSGTGRSKRAEHHVLYLGLYEDVVCRGFRLAAGPGPYTILAHLPRYAPDSSLVYMAETLVARLGAPGSDLFLDDYAPLEAAVSRPDGPIVLLGAAFGLLDLAERRRWRLPADSIVIETGGMKTHRREMGRDALHQQLSEAFGLDRTRIWSEYGMCEMMSQCYAPGGGLFRPPPWVHVSVRDPERPTVELGIGRPGVLAVLDLANVHTASALLTQDRAVMRPDGFEVLGRLSVAELRGCNFLLERG